MQSLGTVHLGQVIQGKRLRILTMVMDPPTALEYYYFVGLGARRNLYRLTTDDTEYTEGESRFSWGLFPCVLSVPWFYGFWAGKPWTVPASTAKKSTTESAQQSATNK